MTPWSSGPAVEFAPAAALQMLANLLADPFSVIAYIAGLTFLSFAVSATAALGYCWYTRERAPAGLVGLLGVAAVALYLQTVGLFGDVLGGEAGTLFELDTVVRNIVILAAAAAVTPTGRMVGDRVATDVFAVAGARELDAEVSQLVRTVGRVTAVELPPADGIADVEGYDPVSDERKAAMAGKTLLFPRKFAAEELKQRLVARIQDDYGVGRVDVDLSDDGVVDYLAVGSRASGLGPTLAPGTAAVAVRADPAGGASPGDVVQVWRTDPDPERVVTAELRAATDDVATVAVDETDAERLSAGTTYRLVTLPSRPSVDREFSTLLRAARETFAAVTVTQASPLVGTTVGDLEVSVVAVRQPGGTVEAIPAGDRPLTAGDAVYVLDTPAALRRFESRAAPATDGGASADDGAARRKSGSGAQPS